MPLSWFLSSRRRRHLCFSSGALVAAGAVVAPGAVCGGGKLWGGNPATALRDLTAAEKSQLGVQATAYADLAKTHAGALAAL